MEGPIQGDAVHSVMCDPSIQYCIDQLTVHQIGRRLIVHKINLKYRGNHSNKVRNNNPEQRF